ncbi:MAG TPA: IS5 family transposase [Bacillota bacterium]
MYKFTEPQILLPYEFCLPFGGKLNPKNQWCQLAAMIPWTKIETKYASNFKNLKVGQTAYHVRMALGALIIQNRKGLSDRETVQEITENPYLQYFVGLTSFVEEPPFDASLMVHFRKRLGKDIINEVNDMIAKEAAKPGDTGNNPPSGGSKPEKQPEQTEVPDTKTKNSGQLILDATCVPADIHYPTDTWLLNEVREALEKIIDRLHEPHVGKELKPRTYRKCARRDYLNIEKKKHLSKKAIRKAIGKQLRYIRRDLQIIEKIARKSPLSLLNKRQYRNLLVSQEIYRQQLQMYQTRNHQVDDRIVSLHMPFIRPIVRGKARAEVEFGAKLSISVINGFVFMERMSFDAFNEGITLIEAVENYYQRFGVYPKEVFADKIYRNRENLQYCKQHGIRFSGPPLGRPRKDPELLKAQHRQERKDTGIRNAVEGKFGEGKRIYGLNRIMARLQQTSETVIAVQLLVMNLEKRLRLLLSKFFKVHFLVLKLSFQEARLVN